VKFGMKLDRKHSYNLRMTHCLQVSN